MQMNFGINADGIKTTLFVPNYCIVLAGIPLHLHTVKLVAKLQQRKETETSQYSLDHWHWHSPAPS